MTRLHQSPLLESGVVPQVDDKLQALMKRLGVEAFPPHETRIIPLERLVVPGADLIRPTQKLVRSIKRVGVLQSPSAVLLTGDALDDPEATFQVIFGRRRILAAHQAGLRVVKCEAYASGTPQLSALLALIEQEQRSSAWIKEIQDLRCLIDEGVGMTPDDLAEFGFDRGSIHERLKMALLPTPILTAIFAGRINQSVARKLTRLSPSQQAAIARLAEAREEITADLVKRTLRQQVNQGLAPLQSALAASMAGAGEEEGQGPQATAPQALPPVAPGAARVSLAAVLATLRAFERALLPAPSTQTLRLLTKTLVQEVEVVSRTSMPIFKEEQDQTEGVCHV